MTAASSPAQSLEVAAQHAVVEVPRGSRSDTAGEARGRLLGGTFEAVEDLVVLEGRRLVGLVPIATLLRAPADAQLEDVMDADPPVVTPGVDQEVVAAHAVERGESSIAVADRDGDFVGLIPPHRMLAVLLAEHEDDMARLGGFMAGTRQARRAAEEGVRARLPTGFRGCSSGSPARWPRPPSSPPSSTSSTRRS